MDRINARYEIRRQLPSAGGARVFLCADLFEDGRFCSVTLHNAPPADVHKRYSISRNIFCPSLLRPESFELVKDDLDGATCLTVRTFMPGRPIEEGPESLSDEMRSQYLETLLYLAAQGHAGRSIPTGLLYLAEDSGPQLYITDVPEPSPGIPQLPAVQRGSQIPPLLIRPSAIPSRLLGLSGMPPRIAEHAVSCASRNDSPCIVLLGGAAAASRAVVSEASALLELSGWRTLEIRAPAGRDFVDGLQERLLRLRPEGAFGSPAEALDELAADTPVLLDVRLGASRASELSGLLRLVEASKGRAGLLLRTDPGVRLDKLFAGAPFEIDLDSAPAAPRDDLLRAFMAADEIPAGLAPALERHEVAGPADLLSMLRFLVARKTLVRSGPNWSFARSAGEADQAPDDSDGSLDAMLKLDDPERSVLSLLDALSSPVGLSALCFVLQEPPGSVSASLERLGASGFASRTEEKGIQGWKAGRMIPREFLAGGEAIPVWQERFVSFVLGSPAATLPELLAAADIAKNEPFALGNILYSALMLAGETGEIELLSELAGRVASLPPEALSPSQARSILLAVEPCRIQRLDVTAFRAFLDHWMTVFSEHQDIALVSARLGEIDFVEKDYDSAMAHLDEAITHCQQGGICEFAPSVLASALRVAQAAGRTGDLANRLAGISTAGVSDLRPETAIGIDSWAAVIQAQAGNTQEALTLLQHAAPLLPLAGPSGRQTYDWCRGQALMAFGELSAAAASLERALLLAENRSDHLSEVEILSSLVLCQERLPGHTVRKMIVALNLVSERAAAAGNSGYRVFALGRLLGLYVRSLQFSRAAATAAQLDSAGWAGSPEEAAHANWYRAMMEFQTGAEICPGSADVFLPGTKALLDAFSSGEDPSEAVSRVAASIRGSSRGELVPAGLYLALEAAARGLESPARILGSALAELYRPHIDEVIPAWRLCMNGLLSARPSEADRSLLSAQHVARQLDRLFLVWMILRVRRRIDPGDNPRRTASIAILLEELDRHVEGQIPAAVRERFARRPDLLERRAAILEEGSFSSSPLEKLRDSLEEKVRGVGADLRMPGAVREDMTLRSDTSWGLEMLNSFSEASRVAILTIEDGNASIVESRGYGSALPPSPEMLEAAMSCGGRHFLVENFGRTPFGSRFLHAVPLGRTHTALHAAERRRPSDSASDGHYLVVEVDSPFNTLAAGREGILMCFSRQISASMALRELEMQTQHDSLTGATISAIWLHRLKETLASGTVTRERPLAVLMMDLDFFKSVNDSFGHREGDRVLKAFSDAVLGTVRPNDILGRLGGEEFGIILPGASEKNASAVAERIRQKVGTTLLRPDRRPVTVSIGISVSPVHGEAAELLVRRADIALYESKRKGRDRSTLWNPTMASTFTDRTAVSLLDTGDPGWDQHISQSALRLLSTIDLSPRDIADETRNALRCEYLSLVPSTGESVSLGLPEAARGLRDIAPGPPGRPSEGMSTDWMFYGLSVRLEGGGQLLAAWRGTDNLPRSLSQLFKSFATLAGLLLSQRVSSEGEP